jgi:hypothetical protein
MPLAPYCRCFDGQVAAAPGQEEFEIHILVGAISE